MNVVVVFVSILFGITMMVVITILVWLFRGFRRIGPVQLELRSKEEDSPVARIERGTNDPSPDQQTRAVSSSAGHVPKAKVSQRVQGPSAPPDK